MQITTPHTKHRKGQNITQGTGECVTSYYGNALFTSVLVKPAFKIIQHKLEQDQEHQQRPKLTVQHITQLLGFYLHYTYFLLQGHYYEEVGRMAMGFPVSPIVANIHMEHFEEVVFRTAKTFPRLQRRYADDTFVIQHTEHKENTPRNTIDQAIKFTVQEKGQMIPCPSWTQW